MRHLDERGEALVLAREGLALGQRRLQRLHGQLRAVPLAVREALRGAALALLRQLRRKVAACLVELLARRADLVVATRRRSVIRRGRAIVGRVEHLCKRRPRRRRFERALQQRLAEHDGAQRTGAQPLAGLRHAWEGLTLRERHLQWAHVDAVVRPPAGRQTHRAARVKRRLCGRLRRLAHLAKLLPRQLDVLNLAQVSWHALEQRGQARPRRGALPIARELRLA